MRDRCTLLRASSARGATQDTSRVASYKTKSLPFQHHEAMLTASQAQHITTLDYIKTTIILHTWTVPIMMLLLSRCALHESNMRTPRAGFGMACPRHSTREQGQRVLIVHEVTTLRRHAVPTPPILQSNRINTQVNLDKH